MPHGDVRRCACAGKAESLKTENRALFETVPVWRAIARMAVPSMLTILVMVFYNMADMYFVGQTGEDAQVAAVSISGPVFTVMMAVGSLIGSGGCALMSRTLGAGDAESLKRYSSLCCWWCILLGVLLGLGLISFPDKLLGLLGANADIWPHAKAYVLLLAPGAPAMIFTTAFSNIIRSVGEVRRSMISGLISTAVNLALDPLFILALGMGTGGAALATVIGNAAGAVYLIAVIGRGGTGLTLRPGPALKRPFDIWRVMLMGLPNAVSSFMTGFASVFANRMLVSYGTLAVAAMGAAQKSTRIISMMQMGLAMGVQPLMGYCCGAGLRARLSETLKKLTLLTAALGSALSLACLFGSRAIVALFLEEQSAIELGGYMIKLLVLSGPFLGLFYASTSFLQSAGRPMLATGTALLRQGILFIPLIYVMNHFFGVTGNICAHLAADLCSTAVSFALMCVVYRRQKNGT